MKKLILLAATAAAIATAPASAALITPVSVTASSTQTHGGFYNAENLIDGSGLSIDGLHDRNFANMWMTELGTAKAELVFNLGAIFDLASADIWQFNYADPYPANPYTINTVDRGVKAFRILTSVDGVDYTEAFFGTLDRANGDPLAAQNISFSGLAQYVKFDILSNYAEGTIYDPYASGLSEVRFNSAVAGAVPEPATWAMMIAGFGLAGAAMRRRATKVAFA